MTAPSLTADALPLAEAHAATAGAAGKTLLDLMYSGFYVIFLLRNRYAPQDGEAFRERLREFLAAFERQARQAQLPPDDVYQAKYAYCALVDECVLMSQSSLRAGWERKPLQLELFGEQLAGEQFFERLEALRREGRSRIQALEVFHMCLLLGFQGKYLLEGSEKLAYLTARLGDEIAHLKGQRAGFAPHWQAPDKVAHLLRAELPLWVAAAVFALAGLAAFIGLRWSLDRQTSADLSHYAQLVKMPAQSAHITITLP